MPASPDETSATFRPSAARSSAGRARASSCAERAVVAAFAGDRRAEQVEIEAIADDLARRGERGARLRGAPAGIAGADADDRQPAARAADRGGVDRPRRAGDGAGRVARLALRHDEGSARAGRGERRAFGDAPAAGRAEHRLGAFGQALGLGKQALGREKSRRHAERCGERMDRRFGQLQFDRHDRGAPLRGETGFGERRAREIGDLRRPRSRARSRCRAPAPADGRPAPQLSGGGRAVGDDDPGREHHRPRRWRRLAAIRRRRPLRSARPARRRAAPRRPA